MTSAYEIALVSYERAVKLFAHRAGEETKLPDDLLPAEELALPDVSYAESEPPPLASIVARIQLPKEENKGPLVWREDSKPKQEKQGTRSDGYYWPKPMGPDATLPQAERPSSGELKAEYQKQWGAFDKERAALRSANQPPSVHEAALHALLERYCWAMAAPLPAGANDPAPDVSLYDFARVSAALAVCLADWPSAKLEEYPDEVALLVGGDVSGVQEWLYTLASSGAAKSLRGRSFYLQLLSEIVALYVLKELDLPRANLLYAGGGNFYILAPMSKAGAIDAIKVDISRKLLKLHDGALYVAIGKTKLTRAMLRGQDKKTVGDAWQAVNQEMGKLKAKRFAELSAQEMAQAIGSALENTGRDDDTCTICKRPILSKEQRGKPNVDEDTGAEEARCKQCESYQQLGYYLVRADYLVLEHVRPQEPAGRGTWQEDLLAFGFSVSLKESPEELSQGQNSAEAQMTEVFYWTQEAALTSAAGQRTIVTYRPLAQCAPPVQATDEKGRLLWKRDGKPLNRPATFDQLKSEGLDRWGVLRMDVDRLGSIFQHGIPEPRNLCRVVGLSGLLRLFFEAYVPHEAAKRNRDRKGNEVAHLYLMYAGGDDLFMVGGWSHLPEIAGEIQTALSKFACNNPDITISGGISLALDKKYPIYQAASDAGKAEHKAKDEGRDALAFLGDVVKWEKYPEVEDRVSKLKAWVGEKDSNGNTLLPRSFLMTLRQIDAEWRSWREREGEESKHRRYNNHGELYLGPWQWHLVYQLARAGKGKLIEDDVRSLAQSIVHGGIKTIGLTARWVEFFTRNTSD